MKKEPIVIFETYPIENPEAVERVRKKLYKLLAKVIINEEKNKATN
jgi:hypothetical protein